MNYRRTLSELEVNAIKWWPKELEAEVASQSAVQLLLATQEKFLSILKLSGNSPEQIFAVLEASGMPANLFLKHLVTLADYGGEAIQRLGREFASVFPTNTAQEPYFEYFRQGERHEYIFKALPIKGLGNAKLHLDGIAISKLTGMTPLHHDMIMILLYAATSEQAHLAALEKCEIGILLGDDAALDKYVREKYIHVSRITTGANTNTLGQIAQRYVVELLEKQLQNGYSITRNGKILLQGYEKTDEMPFDAVITRNGKSVGIEVSFQVTTNSVIERKSGQADARQRLMHQNGHKIAYVLDGAGNFQRSSAVGTICQFSDCTVAYSEAEIGVLANFIREVLA
ncbi:restriction endonuclease [Thiothrix litoralis]|uniref:Restriction endonuclease n=1 Tax=Thiothrix litoralis TaxID=2891210 RepID=A0ABX7WSS0_9GAMM|nr:restriction endonuclease [Thiothrix litoralis]QTR45248.1 restriction endonuclease [Thiothrix litoralis]